MENNPAYQDDYRDEMLNGQIMAMSPRPSVNHNRIINNLLLIFGNYLRGKQCEAFSDGVDVYLTNLDRVIPDMMVVCNPSIIKRDGIHGAPDLIVEILSFSTSKNDKGYKKKLYEQCGVKEYWIVDPRAKTIEVFSLEDSQYIITGIYSHIPDEEIAEMSEEEKAEIEHEFKSSLFDDLTISVEQVFDRTL